VIDPPDLDPGDGTPLQAREEDAPEAVADGVSETAFERLDVKLAVRVGQFLTDGDDPAGKFEATPSDAHRARSPRGRL
jgi:hypothetical protein